MQSKRRPIWITARDRIVSASVATIAASIAVPLLMQQWAPNWFIAAWVIAYMAATAAFLPFTSAASFPHVEQFWTFAVGLIYAALPISTVIWSDDQVHYWIAVTAGVTYIAFEVSALPFLNIGEWRHGIGVVTTSIVVSGVIVVHPLIPLMLVPIVASMVAGANQSRSLKRSLEQHLFHAQEMVNHDELTGLLNRRGIEAQMNATNEGKVTLAMFDMDRFKLVNDTHGYKIGDNTLAALGAELSRRLPESFELARFGGDEFVAFSRGHVELDDEIVAPFDIDTELHGQSLQLKCRLSAGVTFGSHRDTTDRLLSEAGFALRFSKTTGNPLSIFGGELRTTFDQTLEVASVASGDSPTGKFVAFAQTIVDSESIVGAEVLIRWLRPDGSIVAPIDFLPLASANGMMAAIDNQMLEHAIEFASRFNNRPVAPFVSVNITATHVHSVGFVDRVRRLLDEYRVPPSRLMIEVTESEHFDAPTEWDRAGSALRAHGVQLAIDDFGTGYSSIERLRQLPVSHLKFDRSLVQTVSGPFGEIVRGVARYASASSVGVIAEGIETLDELETMRAIGVSMFQGYLFHRPAPLEEVEHAIIADQLRQSGTADANRRSNHD